MVGLSDPLLGNVQYGLGAAILVIGYLLYRVVISSKPLPGLLQRRGAVTVEARECGLTAAQYDEAKRDFARTFSSNRYAAHSLHYRSIIVYGL
jgi:hypothetical protein